MLEKISSDGTAEIDGRTGTKSQAFLNPMSILLINTDAALFWILIFCAKKELYSLLQVLFTPGCDLDGAMMYKCLPKLMYQKRLPKFTNGIRK